jgi:hypothetical protein
MAKLPEFLVLRYGDVFPGSIRLYIFCLSGDYHEVKTVSNRCKVSAMSTKQSNFKLPKFGLPSYRVPVCLRRRDPCPKQDIYLPLSGLTSRYNHGCA